MEEEIPHDEVIQVVLISVMALVKHYKVKFFHFEEPMHEKVVKFLGHTYENVVTSELVLPCEVILKIARLFLATVITSDN